jgi:tetratricopeptide (TPR) repeat protein
VAAGPQEGGGLKYSAFISYNHKDKGWAVWLHRALERYAIPPRLRGRDSPFGPLGKRLPPVFRDRDELASGADLAAAVRQGLEDAAFLVVVCSPNGARSRWVNEEIRAFIAMGRRDRIRLIIVGGEPMSDDPEVAALPPAILEGAESEPLAADARPGQDGKQGAKLKLLAGLLGVPYDELRQREAARRQQRLAIIAAASTVGFVVTTGLAIAAVIARSQAEEARKLAEQRTMTAERTLSFVKGMFRVSDPSIAQGEGEKITAREVVDRGARMLETGLEQEPAARADLGVTLAEVYNALGLYQRGYAIVGATLKFRHGEGDVRVRQLATLAETQVLLGDYERAAENFRRAQGLLGAPRITPSLRSRVLFGLGQLQSGDGDAKGAEGLLRQALAIDRSLGAEGRGDVARDLEALGNNAASVKNYTLARKLATEALAIRLAVEGENSPSVTDNRNALAAIAYASGDLKGAEAIYRANLVNDERVLGARHPDLGITLNNLARMLIDQRRFVEAVPLLERAIAVVEGQRGTKVDDLVFFYGNLGIARSQTGRRTEAAPLFARAVRLGQETDHPMLGPVLADAAQSACAGGDAARGLALAAEAAPAIARDHGGTPWRGAWLETVRGACLIRAGQRAEGAALIARSRAAVVQRWPQGTYIGAAARGAEALVR